VRLRAAAVVITGLAASFAPAHAGATPEARAWLDKMTAAQSAAPLRFDYDGTVVIDQGGQRMDALMKGTIVRRDRNRLRMDLTVSVAVPGRSDKVETRTLAVADGKTMWTETSGPATGGQKVVVKVALEALERPAAPDAVLGGLGSLDPLRQIELLVDAFDLEVAQQSDQEVTLLGAMTEETRRRLSAKGGAAADISKVKLVIEKRSALPREVRIGGERPLVTMRFSKYERVNPDPALFQYTPAPDVKVLEMGAGKP
jgi:hypothetical protein